MDAGPDYARFFFELSTAKIKQFNEYVRHKFPNVFGDPRPINGVLTTDISQRLIDKQDVDLQLFIRQATNGSVLERDRLLEYTTHSFYNELNMFIMSNRDGK